METKRSKFINDGFIKIDQLITAEEVDTLRTIYDKLLQDKVKTAHLRSDLAGADTSEDRKVERITQIMRPSTIAKELIKNSAYKKAEQWAKALLGEDMELDFDMMINKAMPDKRSASCWIALDKVFEENGCMWFIPKTEGKPILPHKNLPNGGALYCETDSSKALSIPLNPGGCTFHDGFTLHFSQGNTTDTQRRALILNFRPKKMIEFEREQGVDHTGERKQRN